MKNKEKKDKIKIINDIFVFICPCSSMDTCPPFADVAQLEEQSRPKGKVEGSIPSIGTKDKAGGEQDTPTAPAKASL